MTKTEKYRIIDELIKEKGGTRKDYENLMNQIAYHESAHTMDPTISQLGGGPGRGKYQFEAWATDKDTGKKMPHGGGVVAARRAKTYYKRKDIPVPKWLEEASKGDNLDVSKLTSQQQDILFLGNMREHPKANFENVWSGKKTATEFWADNHWAGEAKDRDKRMKSFEKSQADYNYNKVDQAKTPTLATPESVKPRVKNERESISTPAVSTAVASQPRIKEPYVSNIDNLTAYIKKIEDTPKPTSTRPGFKDYMKEDFNNLGSMIKNPVKYSDDWKTVGKTLLTKPIAKLFGIEDAGVEDLKSNKEYKAKMNDWKEYDKTMTTPENQNYYSEGGSMDGGNNVGRELNSFNVGGTHESNPNGGVPQGTGNNGKLNTVEQGESSFNFKDGKYIFSNRLGLDGIIKEAKQSLNSYATGGNLNTDPKNNYKVQSGDNLSTIAKNNNISLQDLLKNNPKYASNPNQIGIGDDITIGSNASQLSEELPTSFETFNDAFSYNRKTHGPNKIFEFEGRKFGTNIAGEEFNPDEAEIIENNLPVSSTKKRLAEQNKKVKSPVTNKNTVKLEPEFKDWEEVKAEKDEFNKMDQLEVIKQSYKKQNKKGNYIVIDKKKGLAHVYNNDSDEPIYSTAIDIGENTTDAQTVTKINKERADKNKDGIISKAEAAQATADFSKGNKSTGAGRYTLSNISKDGYQGKPLLNLVNENGVEVATSFHKGFVDDGKSRVSNGCIRCKPATLNYLVDNMKGGEEVYILPEDEGNQFVYENGQLNFRSNNDKDYNSYTDSRGTKRDGQGINTTTNTLNYQPIKIDIDEETFKDEKFTYMDFNDEKEYNEIVKPFVKTLESSKQKVMKLAKINGDVYNDIVKVAFGILGVESNFGDTHSGVGNLGRAIGKYFDRDSSSPDYKSKEGYRELADQESEATSTGLTQIRWNQTDSEDRKLLKKVGITSSKSFLDPKKAALGTMLLLANRYKFQLNDEQKSDIVTNLPTTWNNRGNYADRVKTSAKYINIKQKN